MTNRLISTIPSASQEPVERGRQLFDEAPVAYHEIDTSGIIREVNQAECRLLGYQQDELLGHYIWEFAAPEHRETIRQAIAGKVARAQPLTPFSREYRRSNGTYIWLEIHERLIEDSRGEVVGIRSALLDITDRHRFEKEVRKQLNRARFILRSLAGAIVATDALGNVDFMNPAAESLTGWSPHEASGRALEEICPVRRESGDPVELMSCILSEPAISNKLRQFELIDRRGASHAVTWMITPIRNDDGVILGAVLVLEEL